MRVLPPSARVAVIGAGPGGLTTAKHALEAAFDVSVLEASDRVGGQWHTTADHSGIWPGMRTNTSRAMTAFSDFPGADDLDLHPYADQVGAYLQRYADWAGVTERVELGTRVESVSPDGDRWRVDGRLFDAVVVASGRFRAPVVPPGVAAFRGEVLHAYDYAGNAAHRGRRTLVYGNGVSGHEIGSDLAEVEQVVAAYRKPRYVLRKVVDGVSSDWQWYTHAAALQRTRLPREEVARRLTERVVAVAGRPEDYGAPAPHPDITVAGHSLAQSWLDQVRDRRILCRPGIAAVDGQRVTFTDGTEETVDVVVCATGYRVDVPYLPPEVWRVVGPRLRLFVRTLHPDLPGLGFIGQFALQGALLPAAGAAGTARRRQLVRGRRPRRAGGARGGRRPAATGRRAPRARPGPRRRRRGRSRPRRAPRPRRTTALRADAAPSVPAGRSRAAAGREAGPDPAAGSLTAGLGRPDGPGGPAPSGPSRRGPSAPGRLPQAGLR